MLKSFKECRRGKNGGREPPGPPVLGHVKAAEQRQPAAGQALQAGDAVVLQAQLSQQHVVLQTGSLQERPRGQHQSRVDRQT